MTHDPDASAERDLHDGAENDSVAASVRAMVASLLAAVARVGRLSLSGAGEAVEAPSRALARRITATASANPRPVPDRESLATALADRPAAPLVGGATAAALAARVARRVGPLRFVARRTPMWLVAAALPAVHASVTHGAQELSLVASHLFHRARAAGVDADPERVRRAAVQVVAGAPVDPDTEPSHANLATTWLQRAVRATLPFAEGVRTKEPERLASAAAAVDPSTLGR